MALRKQTISFPMLKGVDEKSSEPYSEPGSVEDARDVTFSKTGQINKRKGFDLFRDATATVGDNGGLLPAVSAAVTKKGARLHKFRDSLLLADGQVLYNKVGTSGMKAVEDLLDCTYANNSLYTPNNKKVGRVNLIRKTVASVEYDILCYVQTTPTGSDPNATYEVVIAVREVESGTFYRKPTVIKTIDRTGADFWLSISAMPSVHLVEDSNNYVYVFLSNTNSLGNNISIQFTRYNFSSSVPTVSSPSFTTLQDNSSSNIAVHKRASSISVDVNPDKTVVYVAYYQSSGTSVTGSATVSRFLFSDFSGTPSATHDQKLGSPQTYLDTDCMGYGSGNFPNIALRYDPADTNDNAVFVAFNDKVPGGKGNQEQQVFFAFLHKDALSFSSTFTDNSFKDRYLVNATCSFVSGTSSDVFVTTSTAADSTGGVVEEEGGGSARFNDGTYDFLGIKSIAQSTTSGSSGTSGEKFVTIFPAAGAATDIPFQQFSSACVVYAKFLSGTSLDVSVIEPGSGFNNEATNQAQVQAELESAFGMTAGHLNLGAISLDDEYELQRAKDHEIFYFSSSRTAVSSGLESICKNASLISDSFREFISSSTISEATGFGSKTYVNISRTNGNEGSFNSCNYLIDKTGKLIASGVPGVSSLNYTSDYHSIYRNDFRLFDGVSRVSAPGKSTNTAARYIFGSNVLTSSGNTNTDAEDISAVTAIDVDQYYSVSSVELVLDTDRSLPAVDIGNQLLIGGGSLFSYDNDTLVENGFYEYPEVRSLAAIPTTFGSRLTANKDYNYSFVYEFVDSLNNLHESVTTPIRTVTTTSINTAVVARVYACDASLKRGRIRVTMYRSSPAGDGVLLKKIKTAVLDESQKSFTFMDFGELQEDFDRAPVLYTTGGVLDNYQPGSVTDIIEHKGRAFLATPTEFVRFSKPFQQGFAPGFPLPQFVIDVPGDSAAVTAIETNVNFLTVFTRDAVFAVSGDGPNAIGQGGFSQPSLLANGQGAIPGSPHLSHSFGVFYIADRGIYLVSTNGQVQYVGAPVEDLVDASTIKQITLFDHVNEIRFLADDGSSQSACYVFNTFFKQWYRWSILGSGNPVDQISYSATGGSDDDSHYILRLNSNIHRQSKTAYQDNAANYDMVVTFRPVIANGLQGVQRIYRAMILYDYKTASTGLLSFAFDYSSSFTENHTVTTFGSDIPNNIRAHLTNQKCRAFKMRILVASSGEGITLNGLAIEAGARPGTFKLPNTQTMAPT